MIITQEIGNEKIAKVYIGKIGPHCIEFAESIQPPIPSEEKWVIILSCLYGCPVKCLMCDAGQNYQGPLSQADRVPRLVIVSTTSALGLRYPSLNVTCDVSASRSRERPK